MIGDLCKPLNPGEDDTVRIVMTRGEAERLRRILPTDMIAGSMADLRRVLDAALRQGPPVFRGEDVVCHFDLREPVKP